MAMRFHNRAWLLGALLPLLLLLTLPAGVQAQFTFTTNNGAITITGYTGSGGAVIVPSTTNGLSVTSIASIAGGVFSGCSNLTSVTIPSSVTNIGVAQFAPCPGLTNITVDALNSVYSSVDGVLFNKRQTVLIEYAGGKGGGYTIPNSVTSIGTHAFYDCNNVTNIMLPSCVTNIGISAFYSCRGLASVTIGNGVADIGNWAFEGCASLTSITIPNSVTSIGDTAFWYCTSLTGIYFKGNAPSGGASVFNGDNNATVYYLPGTVGWGADFGGRPTALWFLPNPMILTGSSFGLKTNRFGFIISWATNIPVVVEACTDLANPIWSPVGTNTLTSGSSCFSDTAWTNYPGRFYRLRSL